MCDDGSININTFTGWESAKFGGLSVDGAEKIINRIEKAGVMCSLEWLLDGTGLSPQVIIPTISESNNAKTNMIPSFEAHERAIFEELIIFRKFYKDIIYMVIQDDGMHPIYRQGEWVAGINRHDQEIQKLDGLDCIIKMEDGQVLFRNLRVTEDTNLYNLVCNNTQTILKAPVLYNVKLTSAAPVIRHYRSKI
jgi:hypothetical protein